MFLDIVLKLLPIILELLNKTSKQREGAKPWAQAMLGAAMKAEDPWAIGVSGVNLRTLEMDDEQFARMQGHIEALVETLESAQAAKADKQPAEQPNRPAV